MVPQISHILILWPPHQPKDRVKEIERVARALDVKVQHLVREKPLEQHLEGVFSIISRVKPDALVVADNELAIRYEPQIIEYVTKNRLPTMYGRSRFVKNGGLVSYGASLPHLYRRSAAYVERIFKGATPADLPVERPTKFDLVVNLRTAKMLGLTIPPSILYEADELIR
jgi:putative ABC transport system substrate-binding protein